jgi:hypothetical protein
MTQECSPAGVDAEEEAAPATELAEKLRLLAQSDPERAADMVAQLVSALDLATGGAFTGQLDPSSSPGRPETTVGEGRDEDRSDERAAMANAEATAAAG